MDPELLDLLKKATEARWRGLPADKINERIAQHTDGQFTDFRTLAIAARESGVDREELGRAPSPEAGQEDQGLFSGMGRVGRIAGEVGTLGFLDEGAAALRGGVHAVGALVPGGRSPGEAFREESQAELAASRERLRQAEEGAGTGTKALGFLGGLLGPGGAGGRFVLKGAITASRALRGAGVGAAEGGLFGFGSAEGSPVERLPEAGKGAAGGGLLGAAIPAAGAVARGPGKTAAQKIGDTFGLTRVGRNTRRAEARTGPNLADELGETAEISGRPSTIRAEAEKARRGIYRQLDEIEEIEYPDLVEILRSEEVAPYVDEAVGQGKRLPSFQDAQGAARQLRRQKQAAMRSGDAASFQRLSNAEREVRRRLRDAIPEAAEADKAYAGQLRRLDALEEGDALMRGEHTADDFEEAFGKLDSDTERQAFREAAGARYMADLSDVKGMKTKLERIQHGRETRRKLEIILGGEKKLNQLADEARKAERIRNRAMAARRLRRRIVELLAVGGGFAGASELVDVD